MRLKDRASAAHSYLSKAFTIYVGNCLFSEAVSSVSTMCSMVRCNLQEAPQNQPHTRRPRRYVYDPESKYYHYFITIFEVY